MPNLAPKFGSRLHSAIGEPCVSSSHMTHDDTAVLRRNPIQEFFSGKGKHLLKKARDRQLEGEITSRAQALGWLKAQVEKIENSDS